MNYIGVLSVGSALWDQPTTSELVGLIGGTAAGIVRTAQLAAGSLSLRVPEAHLFFLSDAPQEADLRDCMSILAGSAEGWAIKYTGLRESFSPYARRGRDSSTNRRIPPRADPCVLESVVTSAWEARPEGTIGLVFQRMVQLVNPITLHLDLTPDDAWIELVADDARELRQFDQRAKKIRAERSGLGALPVNTCWVAATQILRLLRSNACVDLPRHLNIEALIDPVRGIGWFLQLRPTPTDRPERTMHLDVSQMPNDYRTSFVWGCFDACLAAASPTDILLDNGVYIRTSCDRQRFRFDTIWPSTTTSRLILIDCDEGFRLTHEPWNLPVVANRDRFSYMHIPREHYGWFSRQPIRLISDGNVGLVQALSKPRSSESLCA